MEIGLDDLRRHYQDLETHELLHLHRRGGLTDSARTVLEDVLDSREPGWADRDDRWLRSDFESFLREAAAMRIPDGSGDLAEPLFVPVGQAPSEMEIQAAEDRIGVPLPQSYKLFLRVLGPGCWCRANDISAPDDVFAFDEGTWEMNGFVAVVQNVQGVGDHLAFNPADLQVEGERPVYYCSHDPFGYAKVADSFEAWAREYAAAARNEQDFYQRFDEAVSAKWKEYDALEQAKAPKIWWQFWR